MLPLSFWNAILYKLRQVKKVSGDNANVPVSSSSSSGEIRLKVLSSWDYDYNNYSKIHCIHSKQETHQSAACGRGEENLRSSVSGFGGASSLRNCSTIFSASAVGVECEVEKLMGAVPASSSSSGKICPKVLLSGDHSRLTMMITLTGYNACLFVSGY